MSMASALPPVSVDCLMHIYVSPQFSDEEKEMFLARVEWLPVTSHSHGQTDKCKISIMIYINATVKTNMLF